MAGTSREAFLARLAGAGDRPGEIVDRRGRVVGRHRGHRHFTVGQRRGLGVAAPEPLYVLAKDAAVNRVVVGARSELAADVVELAPGRLYRDGARVDRVKLRYRSGAVPCSVEGAPETGDHPTLALRLHEPVYGVAAGQSACLLQGDRVLGHGTIARASRGPAGQRAAALAPFHA
jgi:tRNA-specific 2-thiouridylase